MNNLPRELIPPNQRDLEHAEQGEVFPAEPDEVNANGIVRFYVYPFAKIKEKTLRVRPSCNSANFGLKLEQDPQYGHAYVTDVVGKSSDGFVFSSP